MIIKFLLYFVLYSKPQPAVLCYSDMDPAFRLILQEKEQAVMALQETVEVHTHTHTHTLNSRKQSADWFNICKHNHLPFWCPAGEELCHTVLTPVLLLQICVCVCVCVCVRVCVCVWEREQERDSHLGVCVILMRHELCQQWSLSQFLLSGLNFFSTSRSVATSATSAC